MLHVFSQIFYLLVKELEISDEKKEEENMKILFSEKTEKEL